MTNINEFINLQSKYNAALIFIRKIVSVLLSTQANNEILKKMSFQTEFVLKNHFNDNFSKDDELFSHHFKVGEIGWFNFGVNVFPEISFYHMGIIISTNQKYLYVLPIVSYLDKYSKAYHPIRNNDITNKNKCDMNYYYMDQSIFSFLKHDSILKTTDLRCISRRRTESLLKEKSPITHKEEYVNIYSHKEFFNFITKISFSKLYPDISFQFNSKINQLNKQLLHLLSSELLEDNIYVHKNDIFDISKYIKGNYGYLKNEINVNTSQTGTYIYELLFADNIGNEVVKSITVHVIDIKAKINSNEEELYV